MGLTCRQQAREPGHLLRAVQALHRVHRALRSRGAAAWPDRRYPGHRPGRAQGIALHTIGQRRGLGIAAGQPLFVTELQPATNTVVVGGPEALLKSSCRLDEVNWIEGDAAERAAPRHRASALSRRRGAVLGRARRRRAARRPSTSRRRRSRPARRWCCTTASMSSAAARSPANRAAFGYTPGLSRHADATR